MSRARHRRLQKTRRRYERAVQSLSLWRYPLDAEIWQDIHAWRGHGPQRRPTRLDLVLSIPPQETPFFKALSDEPRHHAWMIRTKEIG